MFKRQQLILKLIEQSGGEIDKTRLVKMLFLVSQHFNEFPKSLNYDFLPYLHGPISFTLAHEIENLERNGYVLADDKKITTTSLAEKYHWTVEYDVASKVQRFTKQFNTVSTNILVDKIYDQYPWFTLEQTTMEEKQNVLSKAQNTIFAIGYEGLMVDAFMNLLLTNGINQLIDVRCNPVTRKYGFHKSTLDRICKQLKIKYIHVPELGIPSQMRSNLSDQITYTSLFKKYETEILPFQSPLINKVLKLVTVVPSALMCMEKDPKCCHRTTLGKLLSHNSGMNLVDLRIDP